MAVKTPGTVAEQPPFGRAGGGGVYGRGGISGMEEAAF